MALTNRQHMLWKTHFYCDHNGGRIIDMIDDTEKRFCAIDEDIKGIINEAISLLDKASKISRERYNLETR